MIFASLAVIISHLASASGMVVLLKQSRNVANLADFVLHKQPEGNFMVAISRA